jgi:hypothetical protein
MNRLLALLLIFFVLTLPNSVFADSEELYGTWINVDLKDTRSVKVIFKPDGKFERFRNDPNAKIPWREGTYKIVEKWTDSGGNIFYKCQQSDNYGRESKHLCKLSQSGKIIEIVWGHDDYPTEVSPRPGYYNKYTRQ